MRIDSRDRIKEFGFTTPGVYRIKILGIIEKTYSRYLSDMKIALVEHPGNKPISMLTGKLMDQSALLGVLNALYDMHFTILSVKKMKEKGGQETQKV